jgi:hypothetical protein
VSTDIGPDNDEIEILYCPVCSREIGLGVNRGGPETLFLACSRCSVAYPSALVKAMFDPFDYACGLIDGTVIRFGEAQIQGKWVHLNPRAVDQPEQRGLPFAMERGVDVRIDRIVWVADAPQGS